MTMATIPYFPSKCGTKEMMGGSRSHSIVVMGLMGGCSTAGKLKLIGGVARKMSACYLYYRKASGRVEYVNKFN